MSIEAIKALRTAQNNLAPSRGAAITYGDGELWDEYEQAIKSLEQAQKQEPCLKGGQCKHGSWCSEVYCQDHCEFVEQAQKQEPTADAIARSKRILALVDDYVHFQTMQARYALRSALMDEFTTPPPRQPLTGGDERRHIICLCPDCTKPIQQAQKQEPVAFSGHVFNVHKFGVLYEWEPTSMAIALPDGIHALYTTQPQPKEQKPVAWMIWLNGHAGTFAIKREAQLEFARRNEKYPDDERKLIPLYTSPPQRQPLTDEQREEIAKGWRGRNWTVGDIIDAVEAAHGIKGEA